MMATTHRVFLWTPRLLGLAFVAFLSLFALDVFNEHLGFGRTAVALAMHLIPSAIVLVATVIGWRWPAAGGALFIAGGAYYWIRVGVAHPSWIVVVAGPMIVVGVLFLMAARYR